MNATKKLKAKVDFDPQLSALVPQSQVNKLAAWLPIFENK
jgi:hypothetical protein